MNNRQRVYICSPYRGDTEKNTDYARQMCRIAYSEGYEPIAPHLYYPQFLDDDNPDERDYALKRGLSLLRGCDELWLCSDVISPGMAAEIEMAVSLGKIIRTVIKE